MADRFKAVHRWFGRWAELDTETGKLFNSIVKQRVVGYDLFKEEAEMVARIRNRGVRKLCNPPRDVL